MTFEMTADGYTAAEKWLRDSGQWERAIAGCWDSVDGYSIVYAANRLWEQNHSRDIDSSPEHPRQEIGERK